VISVIYEEKNQIKPNKLELKISLTHKNQRNKPTNQISRLLKDIRRDVMGPSGYLLRLLLDRTCVKSLPLLVSFLFKFFVPLPRYLYTCKVYIINKKLCYQKKKKKKKNIDLIMGSRSNKHGRIDRPRISCFFFTLVRIILVVLHKESRIRSRFYTHLNFIYRSFN